MTTTTVTTTAIGVVAAARESAAVAHGSTRRTSGELYLNHPRRVAQALAAAGCTDAAVAAGWLHDVVEDTDITLDHLRQAGFPAAVVAAVDSVTHRAGETYFEAIRRAAADPIGVLVKLADNMDNTTPEPTAASRFRSRQQSLRKYAKSRTLLWEALLGQRTSSPLVSAQ